KGKFDEYKERGIPVDYSFSIKPGELNALDWCNIFNVSITSNIGVLIERILTKLIGEYSIEDVIAEIKLDTNTDQDTKNATENRFQAVKSWGLFDIEGSEIKDIVKSGEVSILDTSVYDDFNVKALVASIISKKLLQERISIRKYEELEELETSRHYFSIEEDKKQELPLVWIFIDEGHEFLPKEGKTPATDALIQLIREGRQPGISLVMATQQPGEIHRDVITQSDIVISHRVTAKPDIEALNTINQTYLTQDILTHLNNLPKDKGAAIILDDNNERIYPMRIRPKMSWHSGESLSAIKIKRKLIEL
ncbi:MAG: ATP-binding protein, partial [Nanoarchaeota archaeon]